MAQITNLQSTNTLGTDDQAILRQGTIDKRIGLNLAGILSWARRNGYDHLGEHVTGIQFPDTNSFTTYQGKVYFVNDGVTLPYTATGNDPSADSNLYSKEDVSKDDLSNYTDIVYKTSGGNSAVENMLAGNPLTIAAGGKCSTGGTLWERISDSSGDITDFIPINDLSIEDFGVIDGSLNDQSTGILNAITTASSFGKYLDTQGMTFRGNVTTTGIDVLIKGYGTLIPFNKSETGLNCKGGFDSAFSVTLIQTVEETVNALHGSARLSKLTVYGHDYEIGDIVKVVSEDLIPSTVPSEGTRNGEWGTVYAVSGDFVYLDQVLKNTYTTTPRIARLKDLTADVKLKFDNEDSSVVTDKLYKFTAFNRPKLYVHAKRNGGLAGILQSNYRPVMRYTAVDIADNPSNGQFGYGVDDIGNAFALFLNPYGKSCRHVYTTGTGGTGSSEIENYGESLNSLITNGVAENCTNTAWDTHSQGDTIKFQACVAVGCRASYVARCKDVIWEHCFYSDTEIGFRCLNVTANDFVKGTLNKCSGKSASLPISITSQGGGRSEMVVNGGDFGFTFKTVPFQCSEGTLSIRDRAIFKSEDSVSSNVLAQILNTNIIIESAVIDMSGTDMTGRNFIQLNGASSFDVTEELKMTTNNATGDLFFTTDGSNTATINVDKILTEGFIKSRQADGINGSVILTLEDTATPQNNSGYQSISIGATDPITYTLSSDDNIYLRLITAGGGSVPTSVPDGVFAGQQVCYHNFAGGTLTISDTLGNVLVGSTIPVGGAKFATWQPAGWVFS